jgi:RNA polymerase sigma-70 factor (ECF subfamily)
MAQGEDATALLLAGVRNGDPDALRALLVRDLEWITSYVHRHLGGVVRQRAETQDVVQEVFVRLLERGPHFSVGSRGLFRRLMAHIIQNTLVSMARRYGAAARTPERERSLGSGTVLYLEGDAPRRPVTPPPEHAARAEERDWIRLALELLDPLDQAILRLRDWEELPFAEAGRQVGLAEDAARMRYQRALHKLMRCVVRIRDGRIGEVLDELESGPAE